jgi:hypothetical protein
MRNSKMAKVHIPFISDSNAEMATTALIQEGFQVRWVLEDEHNSKYIWVEVIVPDKNIKD